MIDPYRMVFVSAFSLSILILFLIVYKIKFPKRKVNYFYLLILFSILPIINIFRPGVFESGDMTIHIYHTIDFLETLKNGEFIPRWGASMNSTYGHPVFIFMYIFPYYLISLLVLIGFSYILSFKLVLALSFILSGVFFFKWSEREYGSRGAFVASIFFLYAPYHLIDMHYRADIGEMFALALIPLSLYISKLWIDKNKPRYLIFNIVTIGLLVTSHPALSIAALPLLFAYIFYYFFIKKQINFQRFFNYSLSFILGIGITAIYWYVTISNLKFTHSSIFELKLEFLNLHEILYSPWRYGLLFQGPYGELETIIGYAQLTVVIYGLYLTIKKAFNNTDRIQFFYYTLIFFIFTFMALDYSMLLWKTIPFVDNFQFTYRLLGIIIILTAFISGIVLKNTKNYIFIFFILFAILSSMLNWGNRGTIPTINDEYLLQHLPYSTAEGAGVSQGILKWSNVNDPWFKSIPKSKIQIVNGKTSFLPIEIKPNKHTYVLQVNSPSLIQENTLFYPAWKLFLNNKLHPINYNEKGIIQFKLSSGLYLAELIFLQVPGEKQAKFISIFSMVAVLIYYFINSWIYKKSTSPKF